MEVGPRLTPVVRLSQLRLGDGDSTLSQRSRRLTRDAGKSVSLDLKPSRPRNVLPSPEPEPGARDPQNHVPTIISPGSDASQPRTPNTD